MVDKIQAVFVLHFPLRAKIGQEFKRLLTNLVISVSRHFPSASLEMEGLFGTTTSTSTPHRSARRTGTSSTLLGTARLPDSTTHPAARLQTGRNGILRWGKSTKRSPRRPHAMREDGVKTGSAGSHRLNSRTVAVRCPRC